MAKPGMRNKSLPEVQRQDWDLVILDVTMPGRSGLDVLQRSEGVATQTARVGVEHAS